MNAVEDSSIRLHPDCVKQMKQRIQLWNAAVKVYQSRVAATPQLTEPPPL